MSTRHSPKYPQIPLLPPIPQSGMSSIWRCYSLFLSLTASDWFAGWLMASQLLTVAGEPRFRTMHRRIDSSDLMDSLCLFPQMHVQLYFFMAHIHTMVMVCHSRDISTFQQNNLGLWKTNGWCLHNWTQMSSTMFDQGHFLLNKLPLTYLVYNELGDCYHIVMVHRHSYQGNFDFST